MSVRFCACTGHGTIRASEDVPLPDTNPPVSPSSPPLFGEMHRHAQTVIDTVSCLRLEQPPGRRHRPYPIDDLRFQILPNDVNGNWTRTEFNPAEWVYVVFASAAGDRPHLWFTIRPVTHAEIIRDREMPGTIVVGGVTWSCTCGAKAYYCDHVQSLGNEARDLALREALHFEGLIPRKPTSKPDALPTPKLSPAEFKAAAAVLKPKPAVDVIPPQARIGLRIAPPKGEGAPWQLLPIAITDRDLEPQPPVRKGARAIPRELASEPLPALSQPHWQGDQLTHEERPWARALHALSPVPESLLGRTIARDSDRTTFLDFVAAGRVLTADDKPVKSESLPLWDVLRWQPISPTEQRLSQQLPADADWLAKPQGLLYHAAKARVYALEGSVDALSRLSRLPALEDKELEAIQALWDVTPELAVVPRPEPIESLPVRVETCQWVVMVSAYDLGQHGIPVPRTQFALLPRYGQRLRDFGDVPDGWVKGKGEWIRFEDDHATYAKLERLFEKQRWLRCDRNVFVDQTTHSATEMQRMFHALLVLAHAGMPDVPVRHRDLGKTPPTLPLEPLLPVQFNVRLDAVTTVPYQYVLDWSLRVGEHDSNVITALRLGQEYHELDVLGDPLLRFPSDPKGESALLRRVDGQHWARVDRAGWQDFERVAALLQSSARKDGERRIVSRGVLLGLAFEGLNVPGEGRATQVAAIVAARTLLDAKDKPFAVTVPGLSEDLKPIQTNAVNWLLELRAQGLGGVLADDRGMGKTVEVLAAIAAYCAGGRKAKQPQAPIIVAMEVKELEHWYKHARRFTPGLKTHVHHGPRRRNDEAFLREQDVILTTYDILRTRRDELLPLNPPYLFLDEAQAALRNPETERWRVVNQFRQGTCIVPVTGTPIGRSLVDLWSLLELAVPGLFGTRKAFLDKASALAPHGIESEGGPGRAQAFVDQLRTLVAPFLMRRLKEDYPDQFPEKVPMVQYVTLDKAEAEDYEARRLRAIDQVAEAIAEHGWYQARFRIDLVLDALRQKCSFPGGKRVGERSAKGQMLVEMVQQLLSGGHRILIYSHFNNIVGATSHELRRAGVATAEYIGNPKQRDKELALFKAGHFDVIVLAEIGKSGLDVPEADTVIVMDPWIDQSVMDQMADRVHRISSTYKQVTFYQLIAANTLEEHAQTVLKRYQNTASAILDGQVGPVAELKFTRADVDAMLALSPANTVRP